MGVYDGEAAEFCERIRARLVGALTLACGDQDVAEELAQETLVRAWQRWSRVREMDSPEGWTFRTGFNLTSSWRRRRSAERRANRRVATTAVPENREVSEDTGVVRAAVAGLPERQRAVIVVRFYLGYDVAGAAEVLGCAPGTVKAATHQALANLRAAGLAAEATEVMEAT